MDLFKYPVMITADELKTATGLDLAAEYEQREIAPFLHGVHSTVYESGIYATGDRYLKERIIEKHKTDVETALKRALIRQAEYEHAFGRIGTESGITIGADGQKALIARQELQSKTLCIDAVNALRGCKVALLYAGETV
jgi:hypothetical protein